MILAGPVTEAAFADRRQREWDELDALVKRAARRGAKSLGAAEIARVPTLYRDVAADLARAQAARYSAPLIDYLQGVTAASHTFLYGRGSERASGPGTMPARGMVRAAVEAFPRAVRRHRRAVMLAFCLFFIPLVCGVIASLIDPQFAFKVFPEATLRPLTEAYAKGFSEGRDAGQNVLMAGFYVNNNVGIALRCFACGIFFGLGSAFYLVENGLAIGSVIGYVGSQGAGDNIVTFIVGHSSFELGAIVLSGGAGLATGWSIVSPGDKTRLASLQAVSRDVVIIVFGAAVMLLMAASIEAFWSGSSTPALVKRIVGAVMLVLVLAYLTLVGRDSRPAEEATR